MIDARVSRQEQSTMISFSPLSPLYGAETCDVDLSQPLSDADFKQIEQAFYAHQVLALRTLPDISTDPQWDSQSMTCRSRLCTWRRWLSR